MDKFVIINKERLYLTDRVLFANDKMYDDGTPKNGLAIDVFTDNIFDDMVLTFDSLDNAIRFINNNKDNKFIRPDGSKATAPTFWYTSFNVKKEPFNTKYTIKNHTYPIVEGHDDIIYVNPAITIPMDYKGKMYVPFTFLNRLDRNQFNLISTIKGVVDGVKKMEGILIQRK